MKDFVRLLRILNTMNTRISLVESLVIHEAIGAGEAFDFLMTIKDETDAEWTSEMERIKTKEESYGSR
jgi:hypothetical protein